jgi:multidrug resistance efflux pump
MKKKIKKAINSKIGKLVITLLIVIIIVGGTIFYIKKNNRVYTDSAQAQVTVTSIAPDASGRLLDVSVNEGQMVKKGDVLATTDSSIVKAYTDGLIVKINKEIGTIFSTQTPVVEMVNTNEMRIVGEIDENKGLDQIKIGQPVSFSIDALAGKTFWGYVDEISPSANQNQLSFSISNSRVVKQFNVYVKFDTSKYPEIKNGMSAKMTIFTK